MSRAPLIIVNPAAAVGRAVRSVPWLRERLVGRPDARLVITRRPGEAESLAAEATRLGHDRVIAVGGDGTVQEVVNGLLDAGGRTSLGILPVGSGNDLARSLELPSERGSAWRTAIGPSTRWIDAARGRNGSAVERWFASAAGIGFDAQVAAAMASRAGWRAGRAGYLLTTLSELRRFEACRVRLTVDGTSTTRSVLFIALADGPYYGGGMRIAPDARLDDGHLDVCVVGDISRLTTLRELPNLYRGTHVRNPAVSMHAARSLEVEGDVATPIHLDGEPFGVLPLRVSLAPGVLEVAAVHAVELGPSPPGSPGTTLPRGRHGRL